VWDRGSLTIEARVSLVDNESKTPAAKANSAAGVMRS
jgi:hypothetical protein